MLGFILAFLAAASKATTDLFAKKGLGKTDEYVMAFSLRFFSIPFLLAIIPFIDIPKLHTTFYAAVITSALINVAAQILYMKAIKTSPLSLTIPFLSFAPMFLLVTSYFVLGEFPGFLGTLGVFMVVVGAYILNINKAKGGLTKPLKSILKEKGSRYMLFVAFLYSITTNLDKIAINNSNPFVYAIAINFTLALFLFPVMLKFSDNHLNDILKHSKILFPIGFFTAIASIMQYVAFTMILVVYVSAIKRTASLFSIMYGKYFFEEDNIKERLLGAAIMILGVLMITLL